MEYTSTRDSARRVSAAEAILTGLAPDGGLYVPTRLPKLAIRPLLGLSYAEIAYEVLGAFLPDYDADFLMGALAETYENHFGGKEGYLVRLGDGLNALELWHGPTAAFKDYALQLMPKLLVEAKKMLKDDSETLILVATSGDTGSAALAGYRDVPGVKITVFYPDQGTSELQKLQMTTQEGGNVAVFGVRGNFDDTQRGVKKAFTDAVLAEALGKKKRKLSSANSINWGRLVPQIVYYVSSYLLLCWDGSVDFGEPVDFCVPTGNFGDIMAGWYAKAMGVPIGKLICAANKNNVLADFMETGRYNAKREFHKTSSPSMDILVSSNLERLLWHASGSDAAVRGWMEQLAKTGEYQVDAGVMDVIRQSFCAGWADEQDVFEEIRDTYRQHHYLTEPHTAVALRVWRRQASGRPVVVLSTASPFKFSENVLTALEQPVVGTGFDALKQLEAFSGQQAPAALRDLAGKPIRFTEIIDADKIVDIPLKL
ncbi:MAG: threonine synthase [Oscillospiraceae bacterium]